LSQLPSCSLASFILTVTWFTGLKTVEGFPACQWCLLPAHCFPVLYIIRAFVVLLFNLSFILVTTDITSSCLGSNDGELNTIIALFISIVLFNGWCRLVL
jgi:hypothetical protein